MRIRTYLTLAACLLLACACGNRKKALLPSVSGKAGEVIVVIDKEDWEGTLGAEVRDLLASECPFLPTQEPLYSLVNIAPGAFGNIIKVHRNIVLFDISPMAEKTGVEYLHDVWAAPQCVIRVAASQGSQALELVKENGKNIVSAIEQAERDRVIANSIRYEERSLAPQVKEVFGGSPHFPTGYKLKKKTDDFIWIADEKQYTIQGILIYRYPAKRNASDFSPSSIISHRNSVMKENVPGMFDNTYMTTSTVLEPQFESIRFRGREFMQTRGWWEMERDYMGGPFVSHSFYSADGRDIIVAEAFVYAPKYDKRQYLRQVESILFSWDEGQK